jgi:tetratricopeptide (TPR) repeat protein/outer membrane protein assembly factor BamB
MVHRAIVAVCLLLAAAPARAQDGGVRLVTNESIPRYLERGRELARAQDWEKMVRVLQPVVAGDPEVFPDLTPAQLNAAVYTEDGRIYYPIRELCLQELAGLPPDGLRAFRDLYDPAARELFQEAAAQPRIEQRLGLYTRVFEEYLVSTYGDDALERAADLSLDLGRYYEALALYRRLVEVYPKDTDRELPLVLAKAAHCAARVGDVETRSYLLDKLVSEYPGARVRVEGKAVPAKELGSHPALRAARDLGANRPGEDWPMPGGNPARSRLAADLPEELPGSPFWRYPLSARNSRLVVQTGKWHVLMHDRMEAAPPQAAGDVVRHYPTVRPIVHDGVLFYRDCLDLIGRRPSSGAFVHFGGQRSSPEGTEQNPHYRYPATDVRPVGNQQKNVSFVEDVHRFYDYGGNGVIAAPGLVATLENPRALEYLTAGARPPDPPTSNLLVSYDRATGKTLWAWRRDLASLRLQKDQEWLEDFDLHARTFFRGPGLLVGGTLYALAHDRAETNQGDVSLWALDAAEGSVRFRTQLHFADRANQRLPIGSALALAGGVVYAVPHTGIVAAVSALPPGRVRWIRRYERNAPSGAVMPRFTYNDPVVAAGKLIVAATDAKALFALDAVTGRVAWTLDRKAIGKAHYIAGVARGLLVMAGHDVCGIEIATGTVAWGPTRIGVADPSGRGFVGETTAYVPIVRRATRRGKGAVLRFDVRTGAQSPALELDVGEVGNLLSVGGRLLVANDDEVMCFTTRERELAAIDARIAREGESVRLLHERALVHLVEEGDREAARADFRRALQAGGRELRPIRLEAIDNLLEIVKEKRDGSALDEARALIAADHAPSGLRPYVAQAALLETVLLADQIRPREAFEALERFLDSHAGDFVVTEKREVVSGSTAARLGRKELIDRDSSFQEAFAETVRARIEDARGRNDKQALRSIPGRYDHAPPTEEAYYALVSLLEAEGDGEEAELTLRDALREYEGRAACGEAHLRLAHMLVGKGLVDAARKERDKAVELLDEEHRRKLADLLAGVDAALPAPGLGYTPARLGIPLAGSPLGRDEAVPVHIEGELPEQLAGMVLLAGPKGYLALDREGTLLWSIHEKEGAEIDFGDPGDPAAAVVAAQVAAARRAWAVDDDLLIGDIRGLRRISALRGIERWRCTEGDVGPIQAAVNANKLIKALHKDLYQLRRSDSLPRGDRLPSFRRWGEKIVTAYPLKRVVAHEIKHGQYLGQDTQIGDPPLGPPQVLGQLAAMGWSSPGRVRVYANDLNRHIYEYVVPGDAERNAHGLLLAPPVLDPLGRLILVEARDENATGGRLRILNARDGKPLGWPTMAAHSRHAAILHADGKRIVYHDGSSGRKNLHFIEKNSERDLVTSVAAPDMLRDFVLLRDGTHLFVFTYTMGLPGTGARLFRIDLEGAEVLEYAYPPQAAAYARPLLTQHYVAVGAATPRSATLQLFDREASKDSYGPQPVFVLPGNSRPLDSFQVLAGDQTRFTVPPALATAGAGLVWSTPFRVLRFRQPSDG